LVKYFSFIFVAFVSPTLVTFVPGAGKVTLTSLISPQWQVLEGYL